MTSTIARSGRFAPTSAPREGASAADRLIASATREFATFGFAKATVQDIAAAAGVSKPIFYRHFTNKQAIFERVVEEVLAQWQMTLGEAVSKISGGAEAELRAFFLESLEYGRRNTLIARLITRDTQFLVTVHSDVNARAVADLTRMLEDILERGQAAGDVRNDIAVLHMADLLTEMHYAYANRQLITGVPVEGALAEDLVQAMWSAVRA
jgi:TetR/AcrR family transcriptional regulator